MTRSPILSFLNETVLGNSTIRTYKKSDDFMKINDELLNKNILSIKIKAGVSGWMSVRMSMLSFITMSFCCFFALVAKSHTDSVLLSMLL